MMKDNTKIYINIIMEKIMSQYHLREIRQNYESACAKTCYFCMFCDQRFVETLIKYGEGNWFEL